MQKDIRELAFGLLLTGKCQRTTVERAESLYRELGRRLIPSWTDSETLGSVASPVVAAANSHSQSADADPTFIWEGWRDDVRGNTTIA